MNQKETPLHAGCVLPLFLGLLESLWYSSTKSAGWKHVRQMLPRLLFSNKNSIRTLCTHFPPLHLGWFPPSTVWGQGPRQAAPGPRGLSLCYSLHGCYPQSPGTPNTQQLVLEAATCSAPLLLRLKAANESSLQTFEAMEKRWEMFKKSQHRTFLCNNSLCAIKV